jgi:hypothetical protein
MIMIMIIRKEGLEIAHESSKIHEQPLDQLRDKKKNDNLHKCKTGIGTHRGNKGLAWVERRLEHAFR